MRYKIIASLLAVLMIAALLVCIILSANKSEPKKEVIRKNEVQEAVQKQEPVIPEKPTPVPEKTPLSTEDIQAVLDAELLSAEGAVHYGVRVYGAETTETFTESGQVPAASIVKLFIMEYAYNYITKGNITLETQIEGESLEILLEKMITQSDNDATNKLIRRFSMEAMNAYFKEQGYQETEINRYMMDENAKAEGKDNLTSVKDVMLFLDKLYQNRNQTPFTDMLEIMKRQKINTKIRKNMPEDVIIANKTGELPGVENDVGIIFAEQAGFQVVYLISDVQDSADVRNKIANTTVQLYELIRTKVE